MTDATTDHQGSSHCKVCGGEISAIDIFCKHCGVRIDRSAGAAETHSPGALSAISDGSDQGASNEDTKDHLDLTKGAPRERVPRYNWGAVAIVVILAITVAFFLLPIGSPMPVSSDQRVQLNPDDLRVQTVGNSLRVTNVGADDVEIFDITINDRDDCTRRTDDALIRHSDGCFVAAGLLSPAVQHALWLGQIGHGPSLSETAGGDYPSMSASCPQVRASLVTEAIILRVGQYEAWQSSCRAEIIRANIKTNHGTVTYGP